MRFLLFFIIIGQIEAFETNVDDSTQNEQPSDYSKSIEEVCQENSEMNTCMEGIEESFNNLSSRNQSNDELLVNPYMLDDHLGLFNE